MKLSSQFRARRDLWGRAGSNVQGQKWRMCSGFSSVCLGLVHQNNLSCSNKQTFFPQWNFWVFKLVRPHVFASATAVLARKKTSPDLFSSDNRAEKHTAALNSRIIILEDSLLMKSMWTGTHAQLVSAAELLQTHRTCLLRRENVPLDGIIWIWLTFACAQPARISSCSSERNQRRIILWTWGLRSSYQKKKQKDDFFCKKGMFVFLLTLRKRRFLQPSWGICEMFKSRFKQNIIQFSSIWAQKSGHVLVLWTQAWIKFATFAAIIGQCWKCKYQKKKKKKLQIYSFRL